MGVAPLNLLPELQTWHLAGLDTLLLPQGADTLHLRPAARSAASGKIATPAASQPNASRGVAIEAPPAAARYQREARQAPATRTLNAPPQNTSRTAPQRAEAQRVSPSESSPPAHTDNTAWPPPWSALLHKTRPAPVLWTYPELGADLTGRGAPERSALLKRLIGQLALPRGSNAFWPVSIPETAGDPALEERLFMAGVKKLGSKIIICFGPETVGKTPYRNMRMTAFQGEVAEGRLVMPLPGMGDMQANDTALETSVRFLKAALTRLNIIPA